ncbi:MAG TPA: hypothetical protein VFQ87_01750 [Bradyrhizobium sp.]|jgi:hypothetical protein|nr:hypothetical protein [Bradyrhizobium sp.]
MRIFCAALLAAAVAAPAPVLAQAPHINMMPELQGKTPEEKEAEAQREKAYRESLKKIPDAKATDPWGSVRAEPAKPAPAKPKTKTGSTAQ